MYQRYYRQRKFGRIFSIFLVVGSGLSHYVSEGRQIIKNTFSFNNVMKYQEHFPENIRDLVDDFKEYRQIDVDKIKKFTYNHLNKENKNKLLRELYLYETNITTLNNHIQTNFEFNFETSQSDIPKIDNISKAHLKIKINTINLMNKNNDTFNLPISEEDRKMIAIYKTFKNIEKNLL